MYELGSALYYMAPFPNAVSIALCGIFSYNLRRASPNLNALAVSIADPFVNNHRHLKTIGGRPLHDYVPLYWATHTPMQYVVTVKDRSLPQEDLVFFVMNALEILTIPGVWTTDGNAASNETNRYPGAGAVPNLDWSVLSKPNCFSREYKRKKCAEVLVPDCVPRDKLFEIVVQSEYAAQQLHNTLAILNNSQLYFQTPPINVRSDFYYPA
jgi:hypothetical protein